MKEVSDMSTTSLGSDERRAQARPSWRGEDEPVRPFSRKTQIAFWGVVLLVLVVITGSLFWNPFRGATVKPSESPLSIQATELKSKLSELSGQIDEMLPKVVQMEVKSTEDEKTIRDLTEQLRKYKEAAKLFSEAATPPTK